MSIPYIKPGLSFIFVILVMLFCRDTVHAQYQFDRKAVEISNMGLSITNVGTLGRPNVRNQPTGLPSMEFPRGSGTEHLFEAGIWLGARVEGSIRVSTAAVTHPAGYDTGTPGFEFTNDGRVVAERSTLVDSDAFATNAISHQDLLAFFTDSSRVVNNIPIPGHEQPLYADVALESYNWNFGFAEGLSILRYDITNRSNDVWEDFYVGMYSDMVVRNVNTTLDTGSDFFNKGGFGYLDEDGREDGGDHLYALYVFDLGSTDDPSFNTYAASVVLGAEYRGVEFHPRYEDLYQEELMDMGLQAPSVHPSFWLYSAGSGDFSRPADDLDRYNRMAQPWPMHRYRDRLKTDGLNSEGNYIQLHSIGPFPSVEPDSTVTVYFAFVAAPKPDEYQGIQGKRHDNAESRIHLVETIDWAFRIFEGQYDTLSGERNRYLVPEPPDVPRMRVELEEGTAVVYWDNRAEFTVDPISGEMDFAGYRVYRSKLGDDLRGALSDRQLIREFDTKDSPIGYNTGFDEVLIPDGPVRFPGDDTDYWYRLPIEGMLSGWQYSFSVTAFDWGGEGVGSLESSQTANAVYVFPGTTPNVNLEEPVGVYPNPYRINASWDGGTPFTRKLTFFNLPPNAELIIYTLAGEIVAKKTHHSETYQGDIRWFNDLSGNPRVMSGGEHHWDLLSDANQDLTTGLYLYTVKDLDSGNVQRGRFAIIK
ncbi:hypothetical protein QLX67_02710 [Balneolaceae bacterium ANBcel3]|nr:hypothetical protein [Balneolaceae bacterium ANBcel3]